MKPLFRVIGVLLLAAAAGCANKYEQQHLAGGCSPDLDQRLVAVMPFQGVSESPGSGLIVADIMANELYARGGYVIVTPEVVAARAAQREGETLSPEETGRLVGAPYILTGRVTEYTYKSGVGEQPAVGVTARLIETATGRVLWSATRARTGSAAWFQEDSLGLLTSRICNHLVASLHGEAAFYGYGYKNDEYTTQEFPLTPKTGTPAAPSAAPAPTVNATTTSGVAPTTTSSPASSASLIQAPAPTTGAATSSVTPTRATAFPAREVPPASAPASGVAPTSVTVPGSPDMPPITVTVTLEPRRE